MGGVPRPLYRRGSRWSAGSLGIEPAIQSGLRDRVYGPSLMLQVGGLAAKKDVPIYLFGSMVGVLQRLTDNLVTRFPSLRIGRNGCPEDVALISR